MTAFDRVTENLDWYNINWTPSFYTTLWGAMAMALEKEMGAHYAMFSKDRSYSRWWWPRWREVEVQRRVDTEHKVAPTLWGTFVTNDRWRVRNGCRGLPDVRTKYRRRSDSAWLAHGCGWATSPPRRIVVPLLFTSTSAMRRQASSTHIIVGWELRCC